MCEGVNVFKCSGGGEVINFAGGKTFIAFYPPNPTVVLPLVY